MQAVILIPAYKPDKKIIDLVNDLSSKLSYDIIIVDDGGGVEFKSIFEELKNISKTTIITHERNLGKGASLKSGFQYISNNLPDYNGVITVDADGQHRVQDIMKVTKTFQSNMSSIILGARTFTGKIPLRSKIGNSITRVLFKLLFKIKISDTQTGLRAIPNNVLSTFIEIPYNRYEYESEMLLVASKNNIKIIEVPIETIYENNNSSSHFNPLLDSMKIYFILLRYVLTSAITALVDYVIFINIYELIGNIFAVTFLSRFFALFVNYVLLRKYVFYSKTSVKNTFPKYVALVIASGLISSIIVEYITKMNGIGIIFAKVVAELLIYGFNFTIQKTVIFRNKHE